MRRSTFVQGLQSWSLLGAILAGVLLVLEAHAQTTPTKETEMNQLPPAPATLLEGAGTDQSVVGSTIEPAETVLPEGAEADHLRCYKVLEDSLAEDPATGEKPDKTIIDLFDEQFSEEAGCTLFSKARLFCTSTAMGGEPTLPGEPPPPGDDTMELSPPGDDSIEPQPESDFLCYRVKCPNPELREIALMDDQFGSRSIVIRSSRFLCVPATATTAASIPCGQSAPECNGACEPGLQCQADATSGVCSCQPNPEPQS